MSLFLLTFLALYSGMHVYAFFRARAAVGFGTAASAAIAVFMFVMVLSPLLIRLLERGGYELSARVLSYIAYLWMGLLFLFFCISLAVTAVNLLAYGAGWAAGEPIGVWGRTPFLISVAAAAAVCVYGYFSALHIRTERMELATSKLPAGVDRLKIVQISDVHLGLIVRSSRLKGIMEIVKAENPDIFVSSGDLVDAQINQMPGMTELLRQVSAPYGNYAVTGNHEYYAGLDQALAFTRNAGFRILRGEAVQNGVITVVGVDDQAVGSRAADPEVESSLLAALPRDKFVLLLKHRPSIAGKSPGLFDLQLSGHTHRGQIYPFRYIAEMAYPLNAGRFSLASGSVLRVSRGTGTWGPPIRFLSPPEVTVIELVRKPA